MLLGRFETDVLFDSIVAQCYPCDRPTVNKPHIAACFTRFDSWTGTEYFNLAQAGLRRLSPVVMMRCMATTMRMWVGGRVQSRWMASKVVLPSLGDSITEGEIVEIVKNVGDQVAVDDVVAIAETDKVGVRGSTRCAC